MRRKAKPTSKSKTTPERCISASMIRPAKFVISPNSPVRQIWISALSTSFKLDWSPAANDFVLTKSGEGLKKLVNRLINEQLGEQAITLK